MNRTAEVITVDAQRGILAGITGIAPYEAFVGKHFKRDKWLNHVLAHPPRRFTPLALSGLVTAQSGFDALEGQLDRHQVNGWTQPIEGDQHQIATTIYISRVILQGIAEKRRLLIAHPIPPDLEPGIWGSKFHIKGGQIQPWYPDGEVVTSSRLAFLAEMRLTLQRPVMMPDPELNRYLAELPFDHTEAEKPNNPKFEQEIYPAVQEIVRDFLATKTPVAA